MGAGTGFQVADRGDALDEDERAELHAALDEGLAEMRDGGGIDGDALLNELGVRDEAQLLGRSAHIPPGFATAASRFRILPAIASATPVISLPEMPVPLGRTIP